jgi:Dolichyl-phosphate-mannose-protein mannosyltransferase
MAPKGGIAALEISNKKLTYGALVGLMLYVLVRSLFAAAGKSFWYDEVLTLTVASQGTWKGIVTALHAPVDGQPPLFYVVERLASGLIRNQQIAYRLPSITAFLCTVACVFIYVKERGKEMVALLSAALLLMTCVFQTYSVEARPYSMLVACFAFALVCYQRLPSTVWAWLLAATLALAQSFHYYAVLAMVPFGLTEAAVFLKTRKFRWPVWGALCFGVLPLVLEWKILAIDRDFYGPHFYAQFSFTDLPRTYGEFFLEASSFGGGIVVLSLVGIAWIYIGSLIEAEHHGKATTEDLRQTVLVSSFILLPLIAYVTTRAMHSGLTTRYVLPTIIGFALALGVTFSRASGKAVVLSAVFVLSCIAVHEVHFWRFVVRDIRGVRSRGAMVQEFINSVGHPELPILVPDVFIYLPLAHYSSAELRDRLAFLPYPSENGKWDANNKSMVFLQDYWPVRVRDLSDFMNLSHPFLLYLENDGYDWFTSNANEQGWSLRTIARNEFGKIYLVTRGATSGSN